MNILFCSVQALKLLALSYAIGRFIIVYHLLRYVKASTFQKGVHFGAILIFYAYVYSIVFNSDLPLPFSFLPMFFCSFALCR